MALRLATLLAGIFFGLQWPGGLGWRFTALITAHDGADTHHKLKTQRMCESGHPIDLPEAALRAEKGRYRCGTGVHGPPTAILGRRGLVHQHDMDAGLVWL